MPINASIGPEPPDASLTDPVFERMVWLADGFGVLIENRQN